MAVDSAGDIYIADTGNNAVRQVGSDGNISTVAGNGAGACCGDGGPAADAALNAPAGLAVDSSGDLFVADTSNSIIREVSAKTVPPVNLAVASPDGTPSYGDAVTFTVTVEGTDTPTGTVALFDGGTCLGYAALDGSGNATIATSALPAGSDEVTARYSGDENYVNDDSSAVAATVAQATPTVTLASSANPAALNQSLILTAAVPTDATGSVDFKDGQTTLGTAQLADGTTHHALSIRAQGSDVAIPNMDMTGAGGFTFVTWIKQDSLTGPLQVIIASENAGGWGVGLDDGDGPSGIHWFSNIGYSHVNSNAAIDDTNWHQLAVVFVAAHDSSGTSVTFYLDGQLDVSEAYVDSNFWPSSEDGNYDIGGRLGDQLLDGSLADVQIYRRAVAAADVSTLYDAGLGMLAGTVLADPVAVYPLDGDVSDQSGNHNDGTPEGTIDWVPTFKTVSLTTSSLALGSHSITAVYSGDSNYTSATSATLDEEVKREADVTLTSSASTLAAGDSLTFTATVYVAEGQPAGGQLAGTVKFLDGTTVLGTETLNSSGEASFTTSALAAGTHAITAYYGGDADFAAASASALEQTVLAVVPPLLASTAGTAEAGQSLTFTADVPGDAAGTVSFLDNGVSLGDPQELTGGGPSHDLHFDGEGGSYVELPNFDMSSFTFASWVKRDTLGTRQFDIMSANNSGWGVYFSEYWSGNAIWFTDRGYYGACSTAEVADTNWHFVVVTLDADGLTFYLDGQPVGSDDDAQFTFNGGGAYYLGGDPGDPNSGLNGAMGQTLVFNRGLSAAEVVALYDGGEVVPGAAGLSGLVAGYTFDDISGTTVPDFSDHNNYGTICGGVTSADDGPLQSRTASLTTSSLAAGLHEITTVYSGDSKYAQSTSAALDEEISQDFTFSGPAVATPGDSLTFATSIIPDANNDSPTGTISFSLDNTPLETDNLAYGAPALSLTAPTTTGSYTLRAVYSGDANYPGCTLIRTLVAEYGPMGEDISDQTIAGTTASFSLDFPGDGPLCYEWSVTAKPPGAEDPTFSANDSSAASTTNVTFSQAGNYSFQVTAADAGGQSVVSTVNVTVEQTASSISVTAPSLSLDENESEQFAATELDQFGNPMSSQPSSFNWRRDERDHQRRGLHRARRAGKRRGDRRRPLQPVDHRQRQRPDRGPRGGHHGQLNGQRGYALHVGPQHRRAEHRPHHKLDDRLGRRLRSGNALQQSAARGRAARLYRGWDVRRDGHGIELHPAVLHDGQRRAGGDLRLRLRREFCQVPSPSGRGPG